MDESILTSVKMALMGVTEDYTAFDPQIILNINSVFPTLHQLGVGPEEGFSISDASSKWSDFLGENETLLQFVKLFIVNKVKLSFDPPSSSFVLSALETQTKELEWRIAVMVDHIREGAQ